MSAAGAETPGSPPPHLLQSQNQSQTDVLAAGAVHSGLAAVAAALAGTQKTMTGGLSAMETGEVEDLAPGIEDPLQIGLKPQLFCHASLDPPWFSEQI